jgi:hypothetical protein
MKPLKKHFTKEKIIKSWEKVGFVPFTRQCLQNPKVWHELGQRRNINGEMEDLQHKYDDLVTEARASGLNAGVFDAMIPIAQPLSQVDNEDEQVRQLLSRKGACSAGGLWTTCKSRIGNSNVAIRAQREQLWVVESQLIGTAG